jgi:hypothetical protein
MTRLDFDPDLERLGDALRASTAVDLAREERPPRQADAATPTRRRWTRPRLLAGATGAVAASAAAVTLLLGASTSPPAYAITTNDDGSVLVQINKHSDLPQANAKLTDMGIHEQVTIYMATGPAAVGGPVKCAPAPGATGPRLKVLVGTNGTEVLAPGQSGDNTGEGTYHLDRCVASSDSRSGITGNTGAG